jgi:hypothetical protein
VTKGVRQSHFDAPFIHARRPHTTPARLAASWRSMCVPACRRPFRPMQPRPLRAPHAGHDTERTRARRFLA